MSENIRSVLTSRRENGFHIGSFAPYGYRKDPAAKGHLVIDEESAEIVKEIFNLFADGYGKTAIAKILNDRGVPNPTEYKRKKGFRFTPGVRAASPLWKYSSIQWILANEVYIGNLVQGRFYFEDDRVTMPSEGKILYILSRVREASRKNIAAYSDRERVNRMIAWNSRKVILELKSSQEQECTDHRVAESDHNTRAYFSHGRNCIYDCQGVFLGLLELDASHPVFLTNCIRDDTM